MDPLFFITVAGAELLLQKGLIPVGAPLTRRSTMAGTLKRAQTPDVEGLNSGFHAAVALWAGHGDQACRILLLQPLQCKGCSLCCQ